MTSIETGFQPSRLRLARELKEWSQADLSRRLGLTPTAVSQFESGASRPAPETVQRLCQLLNVPAGFLSLPMTETHDGFFRSLRRTSVARRRRARAIAHIAHDIAISSATRGQLPSMSIPTMPVQSLSTGREVLEDTADQLRRKWRLKRGPIADVVQLLESKGAIVVRLPLDTRDVDAFSLPFSDRPVVVLGADKNDRARSRFDAAHELGHLVVHGEHLWGLKEVEQQAHWFAAAFLMPAEDIYRDLPERADWPVLFDLKRRWQVSMAALLMRARALGKMSESNYLTAIKAASARGWRRVEPISLGPPEHPSQFIVLVRAASAGHLGQLLPKQIIDELTEATAA